MKHLFLVAALALGMTAVNAFAGELDNESSVTNQSMNGTVVVRIDTRTNETSVLTTESVMQSNQQAQVLVKKGTFAKVSKHNLSNELDRDGGASSWYFYNNYYSNYYSYMWYYGNWYNPCYSYNYGYYNYYYYSNRRW